MVPRSSLMRVFVVAGEPSGDRLGAALMRGLRQLCPDVVFDGVGGTQMIAQGLQSRFPMAELSVMGIAEILPKYRALKARIRETADAVVETRPDVLITIDSPDFSFRVSKRVKAASRIRTVHYVAPTVWAWRPGRAQKISAFVDHLLALFPFEPPYFTKHGMECDFVGHPVVAEPLASAEEALDFREKHGVGKAPLLLVLPGSREGEVRRLEGIFGMAVGQLLEHHPNLKVVVPAAAPVAQHVKEAVRSWPVDAIVLDPGHASMAGSAAEKRAAFKAADLALAASGTVSLELAAARTPMVIAYRMHGLSYRIIRWMALVDTVTLVNLVSETRVVPEFLGPDCTPEAIGAGLLDVIAKPDAQVEAMNTTMDRLGEGETEPGLRAAQAILDRMP